MIAVIKFAKNIAPIINYNEQKVEQGLATVLFDNTLSNSITETIKAFNETVNLNQLVYKHKFGHFILSLPVDEKLSNEKFAEISNEFLAKMGYGNCPFKIYKHSDKDHDHLHIAVSTVDFDGNKTIEYQNFKRTQELTTELEIKYGLKPTVQLYKQNESLNEINASKYSICNALKKIQNHSEREKHLNEISPFIKTDLVHAKEDMSDYQIKKLIGDEQFFSLKGYLENNNLIYKPFKVKLQEKLNRIQQKSKNESNFLANCKNNGIYVKKLLDSESKPFLKYGMIDVSTGKMQYVKETKLARNLKIENLASMWQPVKEKSFDKEQKHGYIKYHLTATMRKAQNLEEFKILLHNNGIAVNLNYKQGKVTGMSFIQTNIMDPTVIKLSELNRQLKVEDILTKLKTNNLKNERVKYAKAKELTVPHNNPNSFETNTSKFIKLPIIYSIPDEEEINKKRKKWLDNDSELER